MKLILLSGGSGKRLWPLSNDARSKQFLKVLQDDDGNLESMVQRVWRQLALSQFVGDTFIAVSRSQTDILENQLGSDVRMIIEPERRDTFPAIALACTFLKDIEQVEEEEVICVLPVDPYVDQDYFERLRVVEQILADEITDLALIGVRPTYPSEKYGYITIENEVNVAYSSPPARVYKVRDFVEKPSESVAKELIEENAFWNCGVFGFKLKYVLNYLKSVNLPTQYEVLRSNYFQLPKNSFDYELVEKVDSIAVVSYEGKWKDLGTWNTLTEEIETTKIGNGILYPEGRNTHIINELDIPVITIGISNAIVAVSPDGILVSDKDSSPLIKDIVSGPTAFPMYEERRWGWYRVLDFTKNEYGQEILTKRIGLIAGNHLTYQVHYKRTEIWIIISGSGDCVLDGIVEPVGVGKIITISAGMRHALKAETALEMIEIQIGHELVEEDIHREAIEWNKIVDFHS